MKKKFVIRIVAIILTNLVFASTTINAQQITSNCTSVSITAFGPMLNTYYSAYGVNFSSTSCTGIGAGPISREYPTVNLEKQNTNGSWTFVSQIINNQSPVFTGLTHGTYRTMMFYPTAWNRVPSIGCVTTNIYNSNGQLFGVCGRVLPNGAPFAYSNSTTVGTTDFSDNVYTFKDINGTNSNGSGFDLNEIPFIDATGSKNYDLQWIAITEQGGLNRWNSIGWLPLGQVIGNNFNLKSVWQYNQPTWNFVSLQGYKVTVASQNSKCGGGVWNANEQTFFVCPANSGCNPGDFNIISDVILTVNGNTLKISNLDYEKNVSVNIYNLNGQKVLQPTKIGSEDFDINSLASGMYIANIKDNSGFNKNIKFIK